MGTIAGFVSTGLFALGTLPMLVKAFRTKNLSSYSLGNLLVNNAGNLIFAAYVYQLPPGPVWVLHAYNMLTTAVMLVWYLKYEVRGKTRAPDIEGGSIFSRRLRCCATA